MDYCYSVLQKERNKSSFCGININTTAGQEDLTVFLTETQSSQPYMDQNAFVRTRKSI